VKPPTFRFSLQAALDAAVERRQQWEAALAAARARVDAEVGRLGGLRRDLAAIEQQIDELSDNLASPAAVADADDLRAQSLYIQARRRRRGEVADGVARQEAEVAAARVRVTVVSDELARASAEVKQFERVRENQSAEHRKLVARHEQSELDEAAILRAARKGTDKSS
jgi:flagellar export protein FliJ